MMAAATQDKRRVAATPIRGKVFADAYHRVHELAREQDRPLAFVVGELIERGLDCQDQERTS